MEPADCFFGIPQWICIKIKKIIFWTVQSKMGEGGEDKKKRAKHDSSNWRLCSTCRLKRRHKRGSSTFIKCVSFE